MPSVSDYLAAGDAVAGGLRAIKGGIDQRKTRKLTEEYFNKLQGWGGEDIQPSAVAPVSPTVPATIAAAPPPEVTQQASGTTTTFGGGAIPPTPDAANVSPAARKYRSPTADDVKGLEKLETQIAALSGDPRTLEALQGTRRSFIASKMGGDLSAAMAALQAGDDQGVEHNLRSLYSRIPDGKNLQLNRDAEGSLMFKNPVSGKNEPVTMESLALYGQALRDPQRFEEVVFHRKETARKAGIEEREVGAKEKQAEASVAGVEVSGRQADTAAAREAREGGAQKYDNLLKTAQAANQYAEAAARGTTGTGMKPDDMRQYGLAVTQGINNFLRPKTTDQFGQPVVGAPPQGYEMFFDPNGAPNRLSLVASDLGGALGIANPQLGPSAAANAGLELTRVLADPSAPVKVTVSPSNGTVTVPVGGRMVTMQVPAQVMQSLIAAGRTQQRGAIPSQ